MFQIFEEEAILFKSELEVGGEAEGVFDGKFGEDEEFGHVADAAVLLLKILYGLDLVVGQERMVNESFERSLVQVKN